MPKKMIPVILTKILLAATAVVALPTVGTTQPADSTDQAGKRDVLKDKYRHALELRKQGTRDSIAGCLIYNGRLIPGPYIVVIEDNRIKINGLPYLAPPEPAPAASVSARDSSAALAEWRVISPVVDSFRIWNVELGPEKTQKRALGLINAKGYGIVDSAYFISSTAIKIVFREPQGLAPFFLMLDPRPPEPMPSLDERRREILQNEARNMEGQLKRGSLVILQHGTGDYFIPPGKAQFVLAQLREIMASTPDRTARIAAIREVVHDNLRAEAIADHFGQ